MFDVFGENYFVDFDEIEKYLDMSDKDVALPESTADTKINLVKYELVKMMLEVIISEDFEVDDKLGLKSNVNGVSVPFKLAFNSLLNKNFINPY